MTQANSTVLLLLQSSTERTRYREWLQSETSSQRVFIERSHQEFLVAQKTLLTANSASDWCADIVIFDETIYESDWAQMHAFWEGWQPTFLILLETVDENYSASVLASGVHEYLIKSSLTGTRLRQTVKMLRQQAQLQQNLHICKRQDVFSQAAIGLNQADSEGRFIRVNQRFCDLLGYSETELLQLTYQEVTHPDDLEAQVSQERQLFEASLDNTTFEKRYLTKDGRSVWTRVTLSTIKDSRGYPISDLALVEDISDRQQLETQLLVSEAELRGLFEAMDDVVLVLDRQGTYLKVAPCSTDNLFRQATDLLGQSVQDIFPAEQARAFLKHIQWVLDTQQTQEIEYCLMIQGAEQWFRAKCSPIAADQVIFVARNVTDRKQHEAALAASEAQFRSLVENASDITFALHLDGTLAYISPQVERILGYAPAELIGQSIGDLPIHPEDVVAARQAVQQLMATGQPQRQAEMRWRHYDGHWHYLWGRLVGVCDPAGTLVSIQGLVTDIHAQRLAEQACDESQARFQAIYEQAAVGICLASTNSEVVLAANQWLCDFLGYSENELQQLTYRDYSHPEDQATDDRLMARLIAGELPFFAVEKRLIHKAGEERWANIIVSVVSGPDEQPLYNLAIVQDIRARKQLEICQQQAEIALQEQHDFLQTILDNLPVSLFVKDARPETFGQFVLANQVCEHYFGRSQAEMIGHTDDDFFSAADAAKYQAKDREVMTTRRKSQYEEIIDHPQIGRRILDTIKVPIYDPAGAPFYLLGISADRTAYKQAQQALQEREAQLLEAQRLAHIGNWEFDLNTRDFICSPELLRICGFDNALASPTFEEFAACVHPDDWPELAAAIRQTRDDGTPHALSHRIVRPDGTLRQTFCKGQAIFNEQNQVVKLRGVSQDITEITAAELALRASERKHQALIRALPDLIMRMSRDGVFLDLFAASDMTVLGEPEAFVGRHIFDSDLPTDVSTRRMEYVGKALSTGELQVYEQTLFNGQYQVVEEVRILPSAPEEVLVIVRDITERKAAEKTLSLANESLQQQTHQLQHTNQALALALEELEVEQAERQIQYRELVHIRAAIEIEKRRYQDLFNFAPDGYVVTDTDGVIQEANRAIAVLTGTEQSQLVDCLLSSFIDESDRPAFSDLLSTLMQSPADKKLATEDLKLKSAHQGTIPVAVTGTAIVDEQATCLGSRWRLQDISDRKQVERALQKSEEQLRLALDFGRIGIWDWDVVTSRLVWNDITYAIFGYDSTDIDLTYDTWLNAVHPDDRAVAAATVATAIAEQQNVTVEYRIIRPDGSQRWIADCGHTLCDATGTPVRAIGVVTDITERKQAELALQASERRYATLTENSPVGIFQTDTNGHCVYHNPRWCQLSGLSLEESLGTQLGQGSASR
ncbi:MAG: PAS domain S-box protein [Leptolyngbya sp. SIOISBB]|nr:PAS domain S-box protein [Leptolyngbya sp. SIOISBB]